jgi:hypothetical protein
LFVPRAFWRTIRAFYALFDQNSALLRARYLVAAALRRQPVLINRLEILSGARRYCVTVIKPALSELPVLMAGC